MQIEIETKTGKKKVDIQYPTNTDVEKMWDVLEAIESCESKERIANIRKMMQTRNEITMRLCNMTKELFGQLTTKESDKLTGFVAEQAFGDLDFTRLFKKQRD